MKSTLFAEKKLGKGFSKPFLLFALLFVFLLIVFTFSFFNGKTFAETKTIKGNSMEPTLKNGDRVLADYGYYKSHKIERGDIVTIKLKTRGVEDVKRVIALPEDKIVFGSDGRVYLNGKILEEEYISGEPFRREDMYLLLKQLENYSNTLPKDYYLVLGDNRSISFDSTNYGLILKEQIIGRVTPLSYK